MPSIVGPTCAYIGGMRRLTQTCLALIAIAASGVFGVGCADEAAEPSGAEKPMEEPAVSLPPEPAGDQLKERPWEVVSKKGETFLSNVFYADAVENEQIMPWAIDGRAVIDRLVYPTIGNPNLFVKGEADDELVMVLRLEDNAWDFMRPQLGAAADDAPRDVKITENDNQGFAFFLVGRSARARASDAADALTEGAGVYRVRPKAILANAEPDGLPASLRYRKTLRFVFDKAALASVPAGLYDARFEVRKDGLLFANVRETQYNAVRVFDNAPDEYTAINVTDTQVSTGLGFDTLTADKIDDFVDAVNKTADASVKNAAFITFNGDLHNGGSPGTLRQRGVAQTYNSEAKRILTALKRLEYPIFLTAGNHDGYVALGHVPGPVAAVDSRLGDNLQRVIKDQNNIAWPGYDWATYSAFLARTDKTKEGLHRDIYTGGFTRKDAPTFKEAFTEVRRADRNILLYDGFHQWQKTYGPLYASWTFGKNRYLSTNTYELRQHRRTGWGMYTVNYGGSVGKDQMAWIDRELARGKNANEDIVVLMHHDPRGGHKGLDLGYYFPLLKYESVQQSTLNYLLSEVFSPIACGKPEWQFSVDERESCLHDGLQEWMGPDEEFDGKYLSGVELLARLSRSPNVRTLLVGHAHLHSLEVLQKGATLVPGKLSHDANAATRTASLEVANPARRVSWEHDLAKAENELVPASFGGARTDVDALLMRMPPEMRTLSGPSDGRELAIIRLTSAAELTSQKYGDQKMFGYSLLHVTKQSGAPRINRLTYFVHGAEDTFAKIKTIDVDRTKSIAARGNDNPVDALFDW